MDDPQMQPVSVGDRLYSVGAATLDRATVVKVTPRTVVVRVDWSGGSFEHTFRRASKNEAGLVTVGWWFCSPEAAIRDQMDKAQRKRLAAQHRLDELRELLEATDG